MTKAFFKYSILTLLAICLNMEIVEVCNAYTNELSATSEQQFVAYESQTTRQAMDRFYTHCPNMTFDIVQNVSKDVPTDKYVLRDIHSFGKTNIKQDTFAKNRRHISLLYTAHPNAYYVFGLRKIVV